MAITIEALPSEESLEVFFLDLGITRCTIGIPFVGGELDWGEIKEGELDATYFGSSSANSERGLTLWHIHPELGAEQPRLRLNDNTTFTFLSVRVIKGHFHLSVRIEQPEGCGDYLYSIPDLRKKMGLAVISPTQGEVQHLKQ